MAKETNKSSNGTSFHNTTIKTTVGKLKELFPNSYYEQNDGRDKTNFDFTLETSKGNVFTIYDWKEYRPIGEDEIIEFHIGANSHGISELAKRELMELLK
jgi:hypothetical protein